MTAPAIAPREWMTAAEIAALKLKGLPQTESTVIRLAKREGWRLSGHARQRAGRGGGWEYHVTLLPGPAVAEIVAAEKTIADEGKGAAIAQAAGTELAAERPAAGRLTAGQRAVMEARAAVLTEVDRLVVTGARTRARAVDRLLGALADEGEAHALAAAVAVASERGTISRRSLFAWLKERDQLGLIGLAPDLKRRKDDLPAWFDGWLRHYARPAKPCISEALDTYRRTLAHPASAPTYDQVRRVLAKLGPLERVQGREGKLAMRKRLAYVARDTSDLLPSSVYVGDGKTFDAEIAHPIHGSPFRPEITSWVDAATRVCTGVAVDLDENTFGVVAALRRACEHWGIPALAYTDRGPGYTSKAMADPLVGFLGRAHITPMKALPYNSQAKGIVERLNQAYTPLAKSFPTYIGKDMDPQAKKLAYKVTRSELKTLGTSRLLPSWTDFVAKLLQTIEDYNDRPHSELPKIVVGGRRRHMTPREAWAAKCAEGFEPIVPSPAELDDMFRPYMIRTTRRGLVELFTNSYFLQGLDALDGEEVAVGYDVADASRVWVRRLDRTEAGREPGELIGIAVFEGNRTRYVPLTAERAAMERRNSGRLKRLDAKRVTIEAELRPHALLELSTTLPVPALDLPAGTVPAIVAANDAAPAARLAPDGRPIFRDEVSFARWLLANPGAFGADDAALLRESLASATTRDLFAACGLDLAALKGLARSIA